MRLVGVGSDGATTGGTQGLNGTMLNDALYTLNEIIDHWNTDGLLIPSMTILTAQLNNPTYQPDGTYYYTIGPDLTNGANPPSFTMAQRPQYLEFAAFRQPAITPTADIPLNILSADEFGQIRTKNIQSMVPTAIYMDEQWPVANIYLWPLPSVNGSLYLNFWQTLNSNLQLNTGLSLPPAYARALRIDLACSFAPELGKSIPPDLSALLLSVKRDIKWNNQRTTRMSYPAESQGVYSRGGAYNIYTDEVQ